MVRSGDVLANGDIYGDSGVNDLVLNNKGDVAFSGDALSAVDGSHHKVLYRGDANASGRGDIRKLSGRSGGTWQ